jgi:hypothetical protein
VLLLLVRPKKLNKITCVVIFSVVSYLASHTLNAFVMQKNIVFYFPAVLLLIPNISSRVNWGVLHGLHKIAPVPLSLTASIYRAHKLAYVPSLLLLYSLGLTRQTYFT